MNNDKPKALMCWSSGKDSGMTLHTVREAGEYEVVSLLTTVTQDYDRISMHGVRRTLLEQQAASIGLPLSQVILHAGASNEDYETAMEQTLLAFKAQGVQHVIFGDIFLEDLRKYREDNLARAGMTGVFPIWKRDTADMAREFIAKGFEAVVTCVDTQALDGSFSGRRIDESFLADLPESVDPCGENGEFHSFVANGPIFKNRISYEIGEKVLRDDRFMFCDLIGEQE